jgi:hypothetical protein
MTVFNNTQFYSERFLLNYDSYWLLGTFSGNTFTAATNGTPSVTLIANGTVSALDGQVTITSDENSSSNTVTAIAANSSYIVFSLPADPSAPLDETPPGTNALLLSNTQIDYNLEDSSPFSVVLPSTFNPNVFEPGLVTTAASLTVAENAAATAIGVATPSDLNYAASQLTVTVTGLPTDGTVYLANGTTAVTNGESLTVVQLTGLTFAPTAGAFSESSTFSYTVSNPSALSATGSANLAIQSSPPGSVINIPANTNTNLLGGSYTVNLAGDDNLGLSDGSGNTVNGTGDTIALATPNTNVTLIGDHDVVNLAANDYLVLFPSTGDTVNGTGDTIATYTNTNFTLNGTSNTVSGTEDIITLATTNTNFTLNGTANTVSGTDDTITLAATNTNVTLMGGNDAVNLAGSDYLILFPSTGDTVNGTGDTIATYMNTSFTLNGTGNTVSGTDDTIALATANTNVTLNGTNDVVNLAASDYLILLPSTGDTVNGSGDTIATYMNTNFTLNGTRNTVNGTDDTITLAATNTNVTLMGGNDVVNLAANDYLILFPSTGDTVNGTGDTIATYMNTNFDLVGGNDVVNLAAGDHLGLSGGGGGGADTVVGFNEGSTYLSFAGENPANEAAVIASAKLVNGNTALTLPDQTSVVLVGVTHVDTGIFA